MEPVKSNGKLQPKQFIFFLFKHHTRNYLINPCCHLDNHGRRIKNSIKKLDVASIIESFFVKKYFGISRHCP